MFILGTIGIGALVAAIAGGVVAGLVFFFTMKFILSKLRDKLKEKFASPDHAGPTDIVAFLDISDEDEILRIKQDAYQRVRYLTDNLKS